MKGNILFSIITVSYNSESTIERTILSVLNQTYNNYEYIIIDGGSKDKTVQIIKKYESIIHKYKWISEKDNGIYDAMNKGIEMATGDIIGIVNSDDWLESNALENIYSFITQCKNNHAIYSGAIWFHYSNEKKQILRTNKRRFTKKIKSFLMPIRHPATFVAKSVYNEIGSFDTRFKIEADCDFIYRAIENKIPIYITPEVLSNMSDGGVSNNTSYCNRAINDRYLFYSKRHIPFFRKKIHLLYDSLRIIFKSFMGEKIIQFIRKFN